MTAAVLLMTFFFWPGCPDDPKPVRLSGDMRADWYAHATNATVCVADRIPTANILESWHKIGVKILKRVAYDREESAEHFRRNIGMLAVHEGADGVWLEGREKFPESWKNAIVEAEKDVQAILYARELAAKTVDLRTKEPDVWIAGRHVGWQIQFMGFESENLDTLRLEMISYARRLEQLLKLPSKVQPFEVSKPTTLPDRERYLPFEGQEKEPKRVQLFVKKPEKLGPSLAFEHRSGSWGFVISSDDKKIKKNQWPGGEFTLKLYIPGKNGTWLPYEWRFDLSTVPGGRAPSDAYGLWFGRERWEKGNLHRYCEPRPWRMKGTYRGSSSPDYPHLWPSFRMTWPDKGGWEISLSFSWLAIYHQWPSTHAGSHDRWYVGLSGSAVSNSIIRIDWPAGRDVNFKQFASALNYDELTARYEELLGQATGLYGRWYSERLYDFVKTPEETFHRGNRESDQIFCERVVQPLADTNENAWKYVYSKSREDILPTIGRLPEAAKMKIWKGLGRFLDITYNISILRRDYLLGRKAGKIPPKPKPKPPKEGASALTAPDVDNDDNALTLDEEAL